MCIKFCIKSTSNVNFAFHLPAGVWYDNTAYRNGWEKKRMESIHRA